MTIQEQIQGIVNSSNTKTRKMQQLFELDLTRRQVADTLNVGYGFVQNVYARTYPDRIGKRTRATRIVRVGSIEFQIPVFNRKFGVEIEFFGTKTKNTLLRKIRAKGINIESERYNHQTREHWKIVSDSSIRATRGRGMEIVSPILKGTNGLEQLKKVCESLKEWGGLINKSCGLHIHFDATDFQLSTWKALYKNYITCEATIDSMMPNSRRGNNNTYCQSLIKQFSNKRDAFQKIDTSNDIETLAKRVSNRNRYYKINAESYFRHKSVVPIAIGIRQHSGTIEYSKIYNWINFLHGMVSYSETNKVITAGNLDTMKKFMTDETHNFYFNRIHDLAA